MKSVRRTANGWEFYREGKRRSQFQSLFLYSLWHCWWWQSYTALSKVIVLLFIDGYAVASLFAQFPVLKKRRKWNRFPCYIENEATTFSTVPRISDPVQVDNQKYLNDDASGWFHFGSSQSLLPAFPMTIQLNRIKILYHYHEESFDPLVPWRLAVIK